MIATRRTNCARPVIPPRSPAWVALVIPMAGATATAVRSIAKLCAAAPIRTPTSSRSGSHRRALLDTLILPADDAPLPLDAAGALPFFLLDAHEEPGDRGTLYLFGKVPLPAENGAPPRHVSACAVLTGLTRSILLSSLAVLLIHFAFSLYEFQAKK